MLRAICFALSAGALLLACGDGKKGPGATGEPAECEETCGAGEVCSERRCVAACSSSAECDDDAVCRRGGCQPIVCGDEHRDGDEECDNGERNADDAACTSECRVAVCGDGLIRAGREECDDGENNGADGACSEDCRKPSCGDGVVQAGVEECDDGEDNADDAACTEACLRARCGDGLVWAGHEECDDGNGSDDDACSDGAEGTCEANPEPAADLGWQQGTHTNVTTPTAVWAASPSTDLVAQELQLFTDGGCADPSGAPIALPSVASTSLVVALAGEGTYTFQIVTRDDEGKESRSQCSPPLVVDTTPPAPATALGFLEASPHDTLTVHGLWTRSGSTDVGGQALQLYGGGVCGVTISDPVDVGSATAEQYPIVTPTDATYSFKVITRDLAGNTAVSACSPAMQTQGGEPYVAQFNGDFPQNVVQARVDPTNAAALYVTLISGEIYKSTNSGSTWTLQCVNSAIGTNDAYFSNLVVSPDGTAYASSHTQVARVEALDGEECPTVLESGAGWATYYHSTRLAFDSTGRLYVWTYSSPGGLVSSVDQGDSYDFINTTPSLFNSLAVDPFDDEHLVGVFSQHSTSPVGIHHSLNSGVDWSQTDAAFTDYQAGIRFNPAVEGWIYLGGGHYSKDGGLTWASGAAYDCLEVDAAGAGYRLVVGAGTTTLERAADMTSPSWATVYGFAGVEADSSISMVSVVGSTIAVVLEGSLYLSTNGGSSFSVEEFELQNQTLTASSVAAHGKLVYVAANGRVFKSTNAAGSWSQVYAPANALDSDTELHLNPGVTAQLVARPESWNSTYEERVDVTLDGGASWTSSDECCYGWAGVLALGAADPSRILYFGYQPRMSVNGGLSFGESTSSSNLVWDPWPAAYISPANGNLAWYGEDAGRMYEYDATSGNDTNITGRLPFTDPAGIDLVKVGATWHLRVISRTGQLAVSADNGQSFALVPGSGGLPSAERRVFVSHPDTPNLIATAPLLGQQVAYSPTLGASWVQTPLDNCEIRSLGLTDGQLLIACRSSPVMAIAAP